MKKLLVIVAMLAMMVGVSNAVAAPPPIDDTVTTMQVDPGPGGAAPFPGCLWVGDGYPGRWFCCHYPLGCFWYGGVQLQSVKSLARAGDRDTVTTMQVICCDTGVPMCLLRDPFSGIYYWVRC